MGAPGLPDLDLRCDCTLTPEAARCECTPMMLVALPRRLPPCPNTSSSSPEDDDALEASCLPSDVNRLEWLLLVRLRRLPFLELCESLRSPRADRRDDFRCSSAPWPRVDFGLSEAVVGSTLMLLAGVGRPLLAADSRFEFVHLSLPAAFGPYWPPVAGAEDLLRCTGLSSSELESDHPCILRSSTTSR